jgi:glycosyltransferase involved in cell wall biosynthesis
MNMNYGGMERLIADLIRRTDRSRFESHLLVLQYAGRFAEGLEPYAMIHHAAPLPSWTMLWPRSLSDQLAAIAPDVVHSHSGVWWKSALAARLAGVPKIVHTEHGWVRSEGRLAALALKRLCARLSTDIVAVSDDLGAYLAQSVADRPGKVRVVSNGVDVDHFCPRADDGALRQELGITPGAPIVLSVGRLEAVKAHDTMLRAFALLRGRRGLGADAVLLLVGDGVERDRLQQFAKELGVAGAVRFAGWRRDVEAAYAAAALFTLTSTSEGTSIALLEAMSTGTCPVVTDVGGNAVVLGPELAHRLVPSGDAEAIAAAWERVLGNASRRQRDADSARRRVVERFSIVATVREYEAIYTASRS